MSSDRRKPLSPKTVSNVSIHGKKIQRQQFSKQKQDDDDEKIDKSKSPVISPIVPGRAKKQEDDEIDALFHPPQTSSESAPAKKEKTSPSSFHPPNNNSSRFTTPDSPSPIASPVSNKPMSKVRSMLREASQRHSVRSTRSFASPVRIDDVPTPMFQGQPYSTRPDVRSSTSQLSARVKPASKQEEKAPDVPKKDDEIKNKYKNMTEDELKRHHMEYMIKIDFLKKSEPTLHIPPNLESLPVDQLQPIYEKLFNYVVAKNSSSRYKVYLVISFLGIEVFMIKVLGLDMAGFTMSQMKGLHRYESLLIQLGEKYNQQGGPSNWPIEAQIGVMILMNSVFFLVTKYLTGFLGERMGGQISKLLIDFLANPDDSMENKITPSGNVVGESMNHKQANEQPAPKQPNPLDMIGSLLGGAGGGSGGGLDLGGLMSTVSTLFGGSTNAPLNSSMASSSSAHSSSHANTTASQPRVIRRTKYSVEDDE